MPGSGGRPSMSISCEPDALPMPRRRVDTTTPSRMGRQARRLYLDVRGADLDACSANALRGGGAHDRRKFAAAMSISPSPAPAYRGLSTLTIDETSYRRGHSYLTLVADADARKVVFVSKGRGADNIAGFVQHLRAHNGAPDNIATACIDMSPAFITS